MGAHVVFVYGSLMRGLGNHELLAGAEYICEAVTASARYEMVSLGYFPGVLDRGETRIKGELYRVDDRQLEELDRLEGTPNFYRREMVAVPEAIERFGLATRVWIYILNNQGRQSNVVESGDWRAYNDERENDSADDDSLGDPEWDSYSDEEKAAIIASEEEAFFDEPPCDACGEPKDEGRCLNGCDFLIQPERKLER